MCGITGIFGKKRHAYDLRNDVSQMTATLAHRGPDAWGTYVGPNIAMGHARLSIVDLHAGHQPMETAEFVISYNGEVYNYIELREELQQHGIVFSTHSDTEVVIKAYQQWGKDAFKKFNGQFALILWDKYNRQLLAARDRYGVRPLFATRWQNAWYFASEMKAFDVLPGFKREYEVQHLFEHGLLWNTIGADSIYKGIRSVEPGTIEIYRDVSEPAIYRYYSLGCEPQKSAPSFQEAKDELNDLLRDAVRLRLRSDVPVGMYLSGGIDSSVLSLLTSQVMGKQFKSFSVVFADSDFDESIYQQKMVDHIGSEHHSVYIDYDTICKYFFETVRHAERPLFRTAPVPLFLLSQLVRDNNIKVVITGEGADEILFGYDSYKELKLLNFWSKHPNSSWRPLLLKQLYPHLRHYSDTKKYGLMRLYYQDFLDSFSDDLSGLNIRIRNNTVLAAAFNKDLNLRFNKEALTEKIRATFPAGYENWTLLQKNQFLEMSTLLSGYLLSSQGDRMSLGHGIEGRYPFLDHRLVDLTFAWPDNYKLNGFSQKHILRSAFSGRIPDAIVNRPKLPYQAPDLRAFIRNGKPVPLVEQYLSPDTIKALQIFDGRFVARFLRRFSERSPDEVGYRDNMLLVFILSTQIALSCTNNVRQNKLKDELRSVDIIEPIEGKS